MKIDKEPVLALGFNILLMFFIACNSYNIRPDITGQQRLELAKKMFENKDYLQAQSQFKIITFNNPGAVFIDEAQYYLAECHFQQKEYVLAADEFNRLIRLYPKSQWIDDAMFNIAMCDFKLSPKPALDQTFTVKAVENLQRFIEDFPASDRIPEAERLLKICRTKLSEKEYKAGVLYRKLGDNFGAYVYFTSVIENYYDTNFFEPASYWQAETLFRLHRNKESRHAFEELLRKFPESSFILKARQRLEEIESDSFNVGESSGVSPTKKPLNN